MKPKPSRKPSATLRDVSFLFVCHLSFACVLNADELQKSVAPAEHKCRFTALPVVIDGKPDDKAWSQAEIIDQFQLPWLGKDARPAKTSSKARLLWDHDYLYFLSEMVDTDLYSEHSEHDANTWEDDVFEMFLKPAEDKPGYYEFQVNPKNTVFDMFLPRRGHLRRFRHAQEFHAETKVVLNGTLNDWTDKDQGWSVEGKIPWRDFLKTGGRPAVNEIWKFVLCRYDYSVDYESPEVSWCSPMSSQPFGDFHRWEDYLELRFVGPDNTEANRPFGIETLPRLLTSKVVGSPEPPPLFKTRKAFPKLKLNSPIFGARVPGSDWILAGVQSEIKDGSPNALVRFQDKPDVESVETLLVLPVDDGTGTRETVPYNVTFHPQFFENGFLYMGSAGPASPDFVPQSAERFQLFLQKTVRITRFHMDPKTFEFDPKSATIILEWESNGHNGGDMVFGNEGMMYVTSGDGTSDSDMIQTGQSLEHLLSKLMRIDVDHPDAGRMYSIPKDNPFIEIKNARPEIWAYGFRNPWRVTCDSKTGDIWVGNNGQDLWEQAYRVERGANYGWSVMEGSHPFYLDRQPGPTPFVKPTVEHSHSESRSLTGGVVYHGEKFPEIRGAYIYGDWATGKVWGVKHDGKNVTFHRELLDTTLRITHFCLDSHGEILILDHQGGGNGNMYSLEPNPPPTEPAPRFPRRLSESGLFASVKGHSMQPGMIPYSVNAPLWSDGAHKSRWIGLPDDPARNTPPFDASGSDSWGAPDQTVLVKSFALDTEAGNVASRRWIETRFMVKQQGEWSGYSYEWNDEQSDGLLVDNDGKDREFTIRDSQAEGGMRTQSWHYPSRTECMICHSRAANFVLGLSTPQLNRNHDYGGVVDHQLRVLHHLGLAKFDLAAWQADSINTIRSELGKKGLSEKDVEDSIKQQTATRDQRPSPTEPDLLTLSRLPKLSDPYDPSGDLSARVRSYMHSNCAMCHVDAGGGNSQINLSFSASLKGTRMIDAKPLHHKFDLIDPRIIAPGYPERSVLLTRISKRGPGQMPQLATSLVDFQAVDIFREWIASLPKSADPPKVSE